MALGMYIAVAVGIIIALVIVKLIRSTDKTSFFGAEKHCKICGRKTNPEKCPYCKTDSRTLR